VPVPFGAEWEGVVRRRDVNSPSAKTSLPR